MQENTSPLAPTAIPPSQASTFYEMKYAGNAARRGPLRFEEGVATDTDVPNDFIVGVQQGIIPAPGRPNQNRNVYEKPAAEVMRERAHLGSAAWVEGPDYLDAFAAGTSPEAEVRYIQTVVPGYCQRRPSPAVVRD